VLAAEIVSKGTTGQQMLAPELDKPTAHTLVGYLYTGRYKELPVSAKTKPSAVSTYEAGTCVYCAAVRYQLTGLVDLAKEKIMSLDEEVSISDVLRIAKEHAFPLLPENETWYPAYLESAIKSAMAKNPELFQRPDFITQVEGNSRLLQVVWKTVISSYAGAVASPTHKDDNVTSRVQMHEKNEDVSILQNQPPASVDGSQTTAVANDTFADPSSPETPYGTATRATAPFEDNLKLDDIEPTIEAHQIPEPFTDELGFEQSKTYQRMSNNDTNPTLQFEPTNVFDQPTHVRSDSVIEAEDVEISTAKQAQDAVMTPVEEIDDNERIAETSPLIANGSVDAPTAVKKTKKKTKEKKKSAKLSAVF
jgi:hypothetical protein